MTDLNSPEEIKFFEGGEGRGRLGEGPLIEWAEVQFETRAKA